MLVANVLCLIGSIDLPLASLPVFKLLLTIAKAEYTFIISSERNPLSSKITFPLIKIVILGVFYLLNLIVIIPISSAYLFTFIITWSGGADSWRDYILFHSFTLYALRVTKVLTIAFHSDLHSSVSVSSALLIFIHLFLSGEAIRGTKFFFCL